MGLMVDGTVLASVEVREAWVTVFFLLKQVNNPILIVEFVVKGWFGSGRKDASGEK